MTNIRPINFRPTSIPNRNNPHSSCAGQCPQKGLKMPIVNTNSVERRTSFMMQTGRNLVIYSKLRGKKYRLANNELNRFGSWAGAPFGYGSMIKNSF